MHSFLFFLIAAGSIANANPLPDSDNGAITNPYDLNQELSTDVMSTGDSFLDTPEDYSNLQPVVADDKSIGKTPENFIQDSSSSFGTSLETASNTGNNQEIAQITSPGDGWGVVGGAISATLGWVWYQITKQQTEDRKQVPTLDTRTKRPKYPEGSFAWNMAQKCRSPADTALCGQLPAGTSEGASLSTVAVTYVMGDEKCGKGTKKNPFYPICCGGYTGPPHTSNYKRWTSSQSGVGTSCYMIKIDQWLNCVDGQTVPPPQRK